MRNSDDIDVSVAYRIEHHTAQGTTVVRHLVEPGGRSITTMITRVFEEVRAGFQARGQAGQLLLIEEETDQVVESALIAPSTRAEP